ACARRRRTRLSSATVTSRMWSPIAASCRRPRSGVPPPASLIWSQVALPDDTQRAVKRPGSATQGVETRGIPLVDRYARMNEGRAGTNLPAPPPGEAGLTHRICLSAERSGGASDATPAAEMVRPNWLFVSGLPAKLE